MGGVCSSKPKDVSNVREADKGERLQAEKDNNLYSAIFQKNANDNSKSQNKSQSEIEKIKKQIHEDFKKLGQKFASPDQMTRVLDAETRLTVHDLVAKNKLEELHNILEEKNVEMIEELSLEGFYWDVLHYAAHFNFPVIVEYLLRRAWEKSPDTFKAKLNATTREGWNALMISIIFTSAESFEVLMKIGGSKLDIKDRDNRNSSNLAHFYLCDFAIKSLKPLEQTTELPINEEELKSVSYLDLVKSFSENKQNQQKEDEENAGGTTDEQDLSSVEKDSKAYEQLQKAITDKIVFKDEEFPHKMNSITNDFLHNYYDLFEIGRWMRPHQLFRCDYSEIKLFDTIDPNDIKQGCIGICYFLAILSALAEFPERVKKIFANTAVNKFGVYGVKFFFQGIPQEVIVDDFIPCYPDKIEPFFAKPNGKELWVLLLEKAWAKCFGNYTVVEYEVVDYAMEDILGAPALGFWANKLNVDQLWEKLLEFDSKDYIVSGTSQRTCTRKDGLVASHAYTVISAYNFDNGDRVLKIRNPWGNFEWVGKYSEDSDIWTEDLKTKVDFVKADDGLFFMTIEEFHKWFPYVSVSFFDENYHYQYKKVSRKANHAAYHKIQVSSESTCRVFFRVHQKNERFFRETNQEYGYSQVHFSLYGKTLEGEKEHYELYGNGSTSKIIGRKTIFITNQGYVDLPPGEYMLRSKVLWETNNEEYVVSAYSQNPISFEDSTSKEGLSFMEGYYKQLGIASKNRTEFLDGKLVFSFQWHEEHCILYYENSSDTEWNVETILSNMVNARLGKKNKKTENSVEFVLPPSTADVIRVKRLQLGAPAGFNFKVKPPVL